MKNKKNSIKKITNDNNNVPTVKGQGCKDDCVLWEGVKILVSMESKSF